MRIMPSWSGAKAVALAGIVLKSRRAGLRSVLEASAGFAMFQPHWHMGQLLALMSDHDSLGNPDAWLLVQQALCWEEGLQSFAAPWRAVLGTLWHSWPYRWASCLSMAQAVQRMGQQHPQKRTGTHTWKPLR